MDDIAQHKIRSYSKGFEVEFPVPIKYDGRRGFYRTEYYNDFERAITFDYKKDAAAFCRERKISLKYIVRVGTSFCSAWSIARSEHCNELFEKEFFNNRDGRE
ncbi:MAG: hypothetical protein PHI67_11665 [Candidatus Methanomethylophilaceae archaeon]|nr:hypothetical protein [Candidatus Methanomethylophilaceae archaeon]